MYTIVELNKRNFYGKLQLFGRKKGLNLPDFEIFQ